MCLLQLNNLGNSLTFRQKRYCSLIWGKRIVCLFIFFTGVMIRSYRRKVVTAGIWKAAYRGCLTPPLLHRRRMAVSKDHHFIRSQEMLH